jgi:hypothetical protein
LNNRVEGGIFTVDHRWQLKKAFRQHSEKFGRISAGVRVDDRFFATVDAPAKIVVGGKKYLGPFRFDDAGMQCRNAVCLAIQHVQFVGELMNDHVVAVTGHLHVAPGDD